YSYLFKYSNELSLGAEYDFFEIEDGYLGLLENYQVVFKETKDIDIGLKYQAFKNKDIDVMVIFTTDGQLQESDGLILEDDIHYFRNYYLGNVVSNKILKKYPELNDILLKLENQISNEEMINLNYLVEVKKEDPYDVAYRFLKNKKIIGDSK
ncbi:MAG: glycine betaine ABC transporter substrate-binding protein, partial [Bacilli bacterium]